MAQPNMVKTFVHGLFSLDGRMTRSEFWTCTVGLGVAVAVLGYGLNGVVKGGISTWPLWVFPALLHLAIAYPGFAITVKRGHDRERSAWWTLAFNVFFHVVPLLLLINGRVEGALWVRLTVGAYFIMDYGLFDGTQGPNKYGPSPKGIGAVSRTADFEA